MDRSRPFKGGPSGKRPATQNQSSRERAQSDGMAEARRIADKTREKTERLRKLRLERDSK